MRRDDKVHFKKMVLRMQPAQQATAYSPGRQPWGGDAELVLAHAVGDSPAAVARCTGCGALSTTDPGLRLRSTLGYMLVTRFAGSMRKLFFLNSILAADRRGDTRIRPGLRAALIRVHPRLISPA